MMNFQIIATCYNRKTGKQGITRTEVIDIMTNNLFGSVYDTYETLTPTVTLSFIKTIYEWYWNDIDPTSEDIVKVDSIVELEQ